MRLKILTLRESPYTRFAAYPEGRAPELILYPTGSQYDTTYVLPLVVALADFIYSMLYGIDRECTIYEMQFTHYRVFTTVSA